jgi:hypothetical protein
MKSFFTNANVIIGVLGHRSYEHLQEVRKEYSKLYPGKNLVVDLKKNTHFNFGKLCRYLVMTRVEQKCEEFDKAVKGIPSDYVLIDIMTQSPNAMITEMKTYYANAYIEGVMVPDLFEDKLATACWFNFKRVMMALAEAKKDESTKVDPKLAEADAQLLWKKGEGKFIGTDDTTFIQIMTSRSFAHLQAVSESYKALHGKSLEQAIVAETSGDYMRSLIALVQPKIQYWTTRAYDAMGPEQLKGLGTKDAQLIRVHVLNSRQDLHQIDALYKTQYTISLKDAVIKDTSGDYQRLLLALLEPN